MSSSLNIQAFKDWFTLIVALIATIAGVIFWVQTINEPKFKDIEREIEVLREDISFIRTNNSEILRIVGRLEGKLEKL